ncbi:MAG: hypothetical protein QOE93_1651 [Actinomycetota bacterium]|nr:hypothetical protein [Actinomycetota bacterium]
MTHTPHAAYQHAYYDRHYGARVAAVHEQLAHPMFRSFYDRLAGRVLDGVAMGPVDPPASTNGHGKGPLRVFEVGCGEGFLGAAILRVAEARGLPLRYSGTDLSPAVLDLARPQLGDSLFAGDGVEVLAALPGGSADVVVVKNVLHHLDDPAALLREAVRVVGPTGRVAVVEARIVAPQFLVFCGLAPRRERYIFKGPGRNRAALADAGLTVTSAQRFSWLPFEPLFLIRPGWFRRLLSTADGRALGRVARLDDRLARLIPGLACYDVWVAAPRSAASPSPSGTNSK